MRLKTKLTFFIITLIGSTAFICCDSALTFDSANYHLKSVNSNSNVINVKQSAWNIRSVKQKNNFKPDVFYFVNETVGFSSESNGSGAKFYKTVDGGESWQILSENNDFFANDIYFISSTEGYVVGSRLKPSSTIIENGSDILKTEDGGLSWKSIYYAQASTFKKVIFNSETTGVAVGRRTGANGWESLSFVLVTQDSGKTWEDVSNNLKAVTASREVRTAEDLTDAVFTKENSIAAVSGRGKIFMTNDYGKSWNLVSKVFEDNEEAGIRRLGLIENNKFWIGGGGAADDGKWGTVALMTNDGWNKYKLVSYYFSDVEVLPNNEVFACGTNFSNKEGGKTAGLSKAGVILYSSDNGSNWEIIHESELSSKFTSIVKLSPNKLFASDDNGDTVIITRQGNTK